MHAGMNLARVAPFVLLLGAVHCSKPESTAPAPSATATATVAPKPSASAAAAPKASPPPAGSAKKIAVDKIDPAGKSAADRVAKAYGDALKTGTFADAADLDDTMKKVTPAQWKQVFDATKAKYGDLKSMAFSDAWDDEKGGTMYRFKASFAKADKVELRVDLDDRQRATKFGTYDWIEGTP